MKISNQLLFGRARLLTIGTNMVAIYLLHFLKYVLHASATSILYMP